MTHWPRKEPVPSADGDSAGFRRIELQITGPVASFSADPQERWGRRQLDLARRSIVAILTSAEPGAMLQVTRLWYIYEPLWFKEPSPRRRSRLPDQSPWSGFSTQETCKWEIHPSFESQSRRHQKSKTRTKVLGLGFQPRPRTLV